MKKRFLLLLGLLLFGFAMNDGSCAPLDPSMVLLNFERPFVSPPFAEQLAELVIREKWPKSVFVRRGPAKIVDAGDAWLVTYKNALGRANDPLPTSGGKAVPRSLTIRIRKSNGEIVAISG